LNAWNEPHIFGLVSGAKIDYFDTLMELGNQSYSVNQLGSEGSLHLSSPPKEETENLMAPAIPGYETPMLTLIGRLQNLTTGGSGTKRESSSSKSSKSSKSSDSDEGSTRYGGILFPKAHAKGSNKKRP